MNEPLTHTEALTNMPVHKATQEAKVERLPENRSFKPDRHRGSNDKHTNLMLKCKHCDIVEIDF